MEEEEGGLYLRYSTIPTATHSARTLFAFLIHVNGKRKSSHLLANSENFSCNKLSLRIAMGLGKQVEIVKLLFGAQENVAALFAHYLQDVLSCA